MSVAGGNGRRARDVRSGIRTETGNRDPLGGHKNGADGGSDFAEGASGSLSARTFVLAALVFAGIVAFAVSWLVWGREFSVEELKATIVSWGVWGVLAAVGLMVLHSFVPFPAEIVACVNGMAYGVVRGTIITWVGAMLGAFIAFGLARKLGRPFVETMVARKNWHVLDAWTARSGWQVLLVSRFTPVIAFNLINYAAGLTSVSWWTFAWTTGLGILPLTVLMVVLGDKFDTFPWWVWPALFAGGIVVWIALRIGVSAVKRHKRGALAGRTGSPSEQP